MRNKKSELILTEPDGTPITVDFNFIAAKKPTPIKESLTQPELQVIADNFNVDLAFDNWGEFIAKEKGWFKGQKYVTSEFDPNSATPIVLTTTGTMLYLSDKQSITIVQNIADIKNAFRENRKSLHDEGLEKVSRNKTEAKEKFHSFLEKKFRKQRPIN